MFTAESGDFLLVIHVSEVIASLEVKEVIASLEVKTIVLRRSLPVLLYARFYRL